MPRRTRADGRRAPPRPHRCAGARWRGRLEQGAVGEDQRREPEADAAAEQQGHAPGGQGGDAGDQHRARSPSRCVPPTVWTLNARAMRSRRHVVAEDGVVGGVEDAVAEAHQDRGREQGRDSSGPGSPARHRRRGRPGPPPARGRRRCGRPGSRPASGTGPRSGTGRSAGGRARHSRRRRSALSTGNRGGRTRWK